MKEHTFSDSLVRYASHTNRRNPVSSGNIDLLRKVNRADLSGRDLSSLISNDPAITARVLRVANSSYYGIPNKVSTINHATSLLGVDQVRTLVQAFCFSEVCQGVKPKDRIFDPQQFAAHSLVVSILSRRLAHHFGFQMLGGGEAETAGLLHDIGKSVLAVDSQAASQEIRKYYRQEHPSRGDGEPTGKPLLQVEKEVLGFTHAELGAWLAVTWSLPTGVQEAIFFSHGDLEECLHKEWATVVTIADSFANSMDMSCLPTAGNEPVHESVMAFLESQGKLGLYHTFPEILSKEIEPLKDLYMMVTTGTTSVEESPVPEEEVRPAQVVSGPRKSPVTIPAWMKFLPGYTQISSGQNLLGGAWIMVFIALLFGMVFLGVAGMWGLAVVSGLAAVLVWCVSWLVK